MKYTAIIVLAEQSIAVVERFWAADLNCTVEDLRGEQVIVTRRSGGPGIFIFARRDVLTVPSGGHVDGLMGPAWVGYADAGTHLARIAVSAITRHALDNDLVAQYRTLVSNTPSLAIAKRLGFERYASSVVFALSSA